MKNSAKYIVPAILTFITGFFIGKFVSAPADESKMIFATYNGGEVKGKEVLEQVQSDLVQLEKNKYSIKKRATEEIIRSRVAAPPQADSSEWENQVISKQELAQFLKERNIVESKLSKRDLENIINNMKLQKMMLEKKQKVATQMSDLNIRFKIPRYKGREVKIAKGSNEPRGPSSAPVTIIQIGNFHCPFCGQAEQRLQDLMAKYPEKIRVYYRFELNDPEDSAVYRSAEGAMCAGDQKKFWDYHDLMTKNPPMDGSAILAAGEALQLDVTKYLECLNTRHHQKDVQKEVTEIHKAEGLFAPMFVINGEVVAGQAALEEMTLIIDGLIP